MLLIENGKVLTMQGEIYERGSVLIDGGKILEAGENIKAVKNAEVIDAKGCWVLPGLIDAHCHIGVMEEKVGVEGRDINESNDPVTPQVRALDGVNPLDHSFCDARKAGITAVMTGPGSSNVIGGQFLVMKTAGVCVDDMVVREPAAMKVSFGENPKRTFGGKNKIPATRMGIAALLREALTAASNYRARKNRALDSGQEFDIDMKMEALLPVLNREMPLKAHAHRADDIMTALRIAREFNLDITLDHCTEGELVLEKIIESGAPAIMGPILTSKLKVETSNATAGRLSRAGIKTAICTDHPMAHIDQLAMSAAFAVKEGMDMMEALKAITINAAEIIGADDRLGSIEPGKDADIAIFDGNPLQMYTTTLYTIIDGKFVYEKKKK
ncbi:MAG TPA: amidohydrolase [Clostridiaceae bacterium]